MIGRIMGWMRGDLISPFSLPATAKRCKQTLASSYYLLFW
jgi:hypothetical protein